MVGYQTYRPRSRTTSNSRTTSKNEDSEDSEDSAKTQLNFTDSSASDSDYSDDVEGSAKKNLEFETPDGPKVSRKKSTKKKAVETGAAPPEPKRRRSFHVDIIHLALNGDCGPLQDYIDTFDMERSRSAPLTQAQWQRVLPAWKSKDKSRGLKSWKSKTARGEWSVSGVCAKVINQSVSIYMEIFGLPPVLEGERVARGGSSLSFKSDGMDLFTPFVLTVHRSYCQNLNPEVEPGMVAYDKVGIFMFLTCFYRFVHVHMFCSCRFFST